jgi:hypothetical protein
LRVVRLALHFDIVAVLGGIAHVALGSYVAFVDIRPLGRDLLYEEFLVYLGNTIHRCLLMVWVTAGESPSNSIVEGC